MTTDNFYLLSDAINKAINDGNELFESEKIYFQSDKPLPKSVVQEIEIRTYLSNSKRRERIMYFVNEIISSGASKPKVKTHDIPTRQGRGGGNSFESEYELMYHRIEKEYDQYFRGDYKRELDNLTGADRINRALHWLNKSWLEFFNLTIEDIKNGKHTERLEAAESKTVDTTYTRYREQYFREKHAAELVKINKGMNDITDGIKKTFANLFPPMVREFKRNIVTAPDVAQKIEVSKFYYEELTRQLNCIITRWDIAHIIGFKAEPEQPPLTKDTIQMYYREINTANKFIKHQLATEKRHSYFFYLFLADLIYKILEPIETELSSATPIYNRGCTAPVQKRCNCTSAKKVAPLL